MDRRNSIRVMMQDPAIRREGKLPEAVKAVVELLAAEEAEHGAASLDLAFALEWLSGAYWETGQHVEAAATAARLEEILSASLGAAGLERGGVGFPVRKPGR